jgi:hypothetical protein
MFDNLSPINPGQVRGPITRLRWYGGCTISVYVTSEWLEAIDIHKGDRTAVCIKHHMMDVLLIVKAPFFGMAGYKVMYLTEHSCPCFQKTCNPLLIDVLFKRPNRKVLIPDRIQVITLDSGHRAIALSCPEVADYWQVREQELAEYRQVRKETEWTGPVQDMACETEEDHHVGTDSCVTAENLGMNDVNGIQARELTELDCLQASDSDSGVSEKECCRGEEPKIQSPTS